jgi:hypothetical protein
VQQISAEAMCEVESARARYEEEVKAAGRARSTEDTYLLLTANFVRWLRGEFVPGGTLPKR